MPLMTEAELADHLQLPVANVAELRRRHKWEHVRLGKTIRYTDAQVGKILKRHTQRMDPAEEEIQRLMRSGRTRGSAMASIRRGRTQ